MRLAAQAKMGYYLTPETLTPLKIRFAEYIGKRKKKITRIEVTRAELDEMIKGRDRPIQVQYTLF